MSWHLRKDDLHEMAVDGRRLLFHVPSTSLFELDDLGCALLDAFRARGDLATDQLASVFGTRFERPQIDEGLADLAALNLIEPSGAVPLTRPASPLPRDALTSLVLSVTTGCNLSCSYCYKEDLTRPAEARLLSVEDGQRAIDLLIAESGTRRRLNLAFFGGEPLTALPSIRSLVDYADGHAAEAGKQMDYSVTTNAVLLTDEAIDFLTAHRFGVTVSMDGPQAIHDRNRRTVSGKGSYEVVAANARKLLGRYQGRPVGARVTLTAGSTDVAAIHHHLKWDLGFAEVGFAPVSAGMPAGFCLSDQETRDVFAGFEALALAWRDAALAGRDIGFSNIRQLVSVLHEGSSKLIPCGAGVNLLAVEAGGGISLCHRFAGSDVGRFGHVAEGIDRPALQSFLDQARRRTEIHCSTCRARSICAGGCYHESYARHGDLEQPTHHYCELMLRWVDLGIAIYAEVMAKNPAFLDEAPREILQ
jgi:uncharacterized protein